MAIATVVIKVNVPDEVEDVGEYLNDVEFDAIHPTDGDIYREVVEYIEN